MSVDPADEHSGGAPPTATATRRADPRHKFLSETVIVYDRKIHKSRLQFDRAFLVSGPREWNRLPDHVRCAPSLCTFRSRLKTYLFDLAFPP